MTIASRTRLAGTSRSAPPSREAADRPYWAGLRFDPVNRPGVAFALRAVRFARERPKE